MRTRGAFVLALGLTAGMLASGGPAHAAKAGKGGGGNAPSASTAEVNKLKVVRLGDPSGGVFKWGESPENVIAALRSAIEVKYQPRLKQASADPGMQQRIRGEMVKEMDNVTKSYTKFDGPKSGWDVSIIGPEFQQNTGEGVVQIKEEIWTRYFFFFEGGLYKIFLSFNKDAIEGKTFADFGKEMESKFGKAREIYRDEKIKGGVRRFLDHYEWNAGSDRLRLVDRSEFYGVYCLVLYDAKTSDRVVAKRKIVNPQHSTRDALVEAATQKEINDRDTNDNIVDRITGKEVKKPGDEKAQDITVPSPSSASKPAATETSPPPVQQPERAAEPPAPTPAKPAKGGKGKKGGNPLDGLDL